jgi:hypothetical protein
MEEEDTATVSVVRTSLTSWSVMFRQNFRLNLQYTRFFCNFQGDRSNIVNIGQLATLVHAAPLCPGWASAPLWCCTTPLITSKNLKLGQNSSDRFLELLLSKISVDQITHVLETKALGKMAPKVVRAGSLVQHWSHAT